MFVPWFIAKGILTNKIGMGKQMDKMAKKRLNISNLVWWEKKGTHKGISEDMLNVQNNNDSIRWNSKLTSYKGWYFPPLLYYKTQFQKVMKYLSRKITLFISKFVKDLDSNAQNIMLDKAISHSLFNNIFFNYLLIYNLWSWRYYQTWS